MEQLEPYRGDRRYDLLEGDEMDSPLREDVRGLAPTEEELDQPYVAPGEPGLLPIGVIYQGDWQPFADGMAQHARAQANALAQAGVPVKLECISAAGKFLDSDVHPEASAQVAHLRGITVDSVALAIRQAVLHTPDFTRSLVLPNGARLVDQELAADMCRRTIVYTSWERDRVPEAIVRILNQCGEVWVPCEANRRAFVNSGSRNVVVVPYPYLPGVGASAIAAPYGSERVPDGRRFYSIGKWEPRKDQMRLLLAFLLAFKPVQKVSLVIKTSNYGQWVFRTDAAGAGVGALREYPTVEQSLEIVGNDPRVRANGWTDASLQRRIQIITGRLSDTEIVKLHAQNNIYVSVSHGEAWDIPAFDARCAGNRLVHVGYGGSEDYAGEGDVKIPYHMAPTHPAYEWGTEAQWAEYNEDDLVAALRAAYPPEKRIHPKEFNGRFSYHAVGEWMKERLWSVGDYADQKAWPETWDRMLAGSYG